MRRFWIGLVAAFLLAPSTAAAQTESAKVLIYSGTTGYEFDHIVDAAEREWLRDAIESGRYHQPLDPDRKRALLRRLSQVEGFERYLHKAFFGQKRFSLEGTDMMVPILDEVIERAGTDRLGQLVRTHDRRHVRGGLRRGRLRERRVVDSGGERLGIEPLKEIPPGGIHRVGIVPVAFVDIENVPRVGAVEGPEVS